MTPIPLVREFFDRYADRFDDLYGTPRGPLQWIINCYFRKSMKARFERTMAVCQPVKGRTVLDLGCGPGHYAIAFAKAGASQVVGVDFSLQMIRLAEARSREAQVESICRFVEADVLAYSEEKKFDYVVGLGLTDYVQDTGRLLQQIVLNTKGKAVLSFPKAGGFLAWQRRVRYRRRCELYLYSQGQIEELLKQLVREATRKLRWTIKSCHRDFLVVIEIM